MSPGEEKKKVKEKENAKVDSKEREERSLVKNKHRIPNGSLQKVVLGRPKEEEARRVFPKGKKTPL